MSIKIQFKGVNKKLLASSVNTFSQFLEKLRKLFNQLPLSFQCCLVNDGEKIRLHDEATFLEIRKNPTIGKVYILEYDEQQIRFTQDPSNVSMISELAEPKDKKSVLSKQPQTRKENEISYHQLKSLNYLDAIYKIFDPNYTQQTYDNQIKPWIKLEDIKMENVLTVTQIWKASQSLVKKIVEDDD